MTPQQQAEIDDAITFLELIGKPCLSGANDHEWRKCPRCLAINEIESRQPMSARLLASAIAALRAQQMTTEKDKDDLGAQSATEGDAALSEGSIHSPNTGA